MTKGELLKALDGLDDEAQIYISTSDNDIYCYNIRGYCDKVTGDEDYDCRGRKWEIKEND